MDWDEFAEGCLAVGKVICGIASGALFVIGSFAWIVVPIALAFWPSLAQVGTNPGWCFPWIGLFILHIGVCLLLAGLAVRHLPTHIKKLLKRIADASAGED